MIFFFFLSGKASILRKKIGLQLISLYSVVFYFQSGCLAEQLVLLALNQEVPGLNPMSLNSEYVCTVLDCTNLSLSPFCHLNVMEILLKRCEKTQIIIIILCWITLKVPITTAADNTFKCFFLWFFKENVLIFHVTHLLGRRFTWNVKTYFLWKIKK